MNILNGYILFARKPILVRGYLAIIGFAGIVAGWWAQSIALSTISAFLLGAYFSPMLPIWRDPMSEADMKFVRYRQASPESQLGIYYWLAPALATAMIVVVVARWFADK